MKYRAGDYKSDLTDLKKKLVKGFFFLIFIYLKILFTGACQVLTVACGI